jgi:hypothetical protein
MDVKSLITSLGSLQERDIQLNGFSRKVRFLLTLIMLSVIIAIVTMRSDFLVNVVALLQ